MPKYSPPISSLVQKFGLRGADLYLRDVVPYLRLLGLFTPLLLSACNSGYTNLPNINTNRSQASSITFLPITLRTKNQENGLNNVKAAEPNSLRNAHLTRLGSTLKRIQSNGDDAYRVPLPFIKMHAQLIDAHANKIQWSHDDIRVIRKKLDKRCAHVSEQEVCTLSDKELEVRFFSELADSGLWNFDSLGSPTKVVFLRKPSNGYDSQLKLFFERTNDSLTLSVRWNNDLTRRENSLHTRWYELDGLREYRSLFTYNEDELSHLLETGSIDGAYFTASLQIVKSDPSSNKIGLSSRSTWATQIDEGVLEFEVSASDEKVQSISSFINRADGSTYSSMAHDAFGSDGTLISNRYCINSGDLDCALPDSWVHR